MPITLTSSSRIFAGVRAVFGVPSPDLIVQDQNGQDTHPYSETSFARRAAANLTASFICLLMFAGLGAGLSVATPALLAALGVGGIAALGFVTTGIALTVAAGVSAFAFAVPVAGALLVASPRVIVGGALMIVGGTLVAREILRSLNKMHMDNITANLKKEEEGNVLNDIRNNHPITSVKNAFMAVISAFVEVGKAVREFVSARSAPEKLTEVSHSVENASSSLSDQQQNFDTLQEVVNEKSSQPEYNDSSSNLSGDVEKPSTPLTNISVSNSELIPDQVDPTVEKLSSEQCHLNRQTPEGEKGVSKRSQG